MSIHILETLDFDKNNTNKSFTKQQIYNREESTNTCKQNRNFDDRNQCIDHKNQCSYGAHQVYQPRFDILIIQYILYRFNELMQSRRNTDVEFYERKIHILQDDNAVLFGQNTQLRKQLRQADQFKYRYEILLKNSQKQIQGLKSKHEKELMELKDGVISATFRQKEKQWKQQIINLQKKFRKQAQEQGSIYQKEIAMLKQKIKEYEESNEENELCGYKMKRYQKEKIAMMEQIEDIKAQCNKQRQEELENLKIHLSQSFRQKLSNQKQQLENKIAELEQQLVEIQLKKDNQQFQFPKKDFKETINLNDILEEKGKQYKLSLNAIQQSLHNKNTEIASILQERLATETHHREELTQKNNMIRQLERKIMDKEKSHETQLFNLIQRQTIIKEKQLKELRDEISQLKQTIEKDKALTHQRDRHHSAEVEEMFKKFEDEKKKILDQKHMHERKISDLSLKLKEADGQREFGQTQMLINSIKDIEGKEQQMGGYQNGVVFLERQLKKCQLKLDQRTRTINKLYQDINDIRAQMDKQLQEVKQQARKEKKDLSDRVIALEEENNNLFDKIRQHNKAEQKKQRQAFKQKTELEQKILGLQQLVEQLQRDYKRAIEAKKGAEASYRSEREKNVSNVSDTSNLKKQKWLQLEKQKKNLEVIYRDKEEQNKMKYEQQLDQKTNILDRLKQEHELTKKQNEILKAENKKYIQEIQANKQNNKLAEYNKKVASLSLELALTQNIYDSIVKAKGVTTQLVESQSVSDSEVHINERKESNEPNSPGSPTFPKGQLMMSFCKNPFSQ